jgi:hypothetical protein
MAEAPGPGAARGAYLSGVSAGAFQYRRSHPQPAGSPGPSALARQRPGTVPVLPLRGDLPAGSWVRAHPEHQAAGMRRERNPDRFRAPLEPTPGGVRSFGRVASDFTASVGSRAWPRIRFLGSSHSRGGPGGRRVPRWGRPATRLYASDARACPAPSSPAGGVR